MPFKSKAQQRFMFSQHPDIAKRWAKEMPAGSIKKLPDTAKKGGSKAKAKLAALRKMAGK
jgi:hypothetical protein